MSAHDDAPSLHTPSPWLTPREAAARAKCSTKLLYNAIRRGKLKAARLGVRNDIRLHEAWVDAWITATSVINPEAPGGEDGSTVTAAFASRAGALAAAGRRRK